MARYRPVDVRLWNDRKFMALSDDAKLLWLFFLTTPSNMPIPGVIVAGPAAIAEQLGWTMKRYEERFGELSRNGIGVHREGLVVWLRNALKYQPPPNPNVVIAWSKFWDEIPEVALKHSIWEALKSACKSWGQVFEDRYPEPSRYGIPNGIGNGMPNQEQEQEQHQEQEQEGECAQFAAGTQVGIPAAPSAPLPPPSPKSRKPKATKPAPTEQELRDATLVLEKLSARSGVSYRSEAHRELVIARLREGIKPIELRAVIAYCAEKRGWQDDPKMQDYLQPSTLFGPRKIHEYLDAARSWAEREYPDEFGEAVTP